ncbi:MAG: tRNA-queuosine alpha-mannosyltransferase domain-containing protein [Planctomycetota bacterium]|jgi:glycosyltransferase involved in cell wall biosynthesis
MKILALEPYYGGSHRSFLDGWMNRSGHDWTLLTLPPTKWKWRMRHGAVTLSGRVAERVAGGEGWDQLFCSDMLNLAEFLGLAPGPVRTLPRVAYFHENQITYPVEHESEFDHHFAFTNMTTALASTRVWFNSAFHRDSFLSGLRNFLERMPDHTSLESLDAILEKSSVRPPGIDPFPSRGERKPGPLRILWAARWEYDKAPETFFTAVEKIAARGTPFHLSVIGGGKARRIPPVFDEAKRRFKADILHWGFQESKEAYRSVLTEADVVVSTARHEFFGMGLVEAVAAGAFPLVPDRLAYPEVLADGEVEGKDSFFYKDDGEELPRRLTDLAGRVRDGDLWQGDAERGVRAVAKFSWSRLQPEWDLELERLAEPANPGI